MNRFPPIDETDFSLQNFDELTTQYFIGPCRSCPVGRFVRTLSDRASHYPELFPCGTEYFLVYMLVGRVKRIDIHRRNGLDTSRRNRCKPRITRIKRAVESGKIIQVFYSRTKTSLLIFQVQCHSFFLGDVSEIVIGHPLQRQ